MKLLVNGSDCSASLANDPPLKITRTLNKPSTCSFVLAAGTSVPGRNSFIEVSADNGVLLFTGYVFSDPFLEYCGDGLSGAQYRTVVIAISEEYVLNRQVVPTFGGAVNEAAADVLRTLTERTGAAGISTAGLLGGPSIARYVPRGGAQWSDHAGELASQSRQSYRVLGGAARMISVGSIVHELDESSLSLRNVALDCSKPLANDVTLTGADEADEFVTELFQGDGTTKEFVLSRTPWKPSKGDLLTDGFTESTINTQVWNIVDSGSHLSLGPGGLTMSGGNGVDGQTTLSMFDPMEMGGAIVLEAGNVSLAAGSVGQICGLYSGAVQLSGCVAGWNVRSSNGALLLAPVLYGAEVATPFALTPNHAYTLRIRLHVPEVTRVLATYYSTTVQGAMARGGGLVASPAWVEFELQDSAAAVNSPATVLYDSTMSATPATAVFCASNSIALTGSIGYVTVTRTGTTRVSSVPVGGTERTRRIGTAAQGAECHLSSEKLYFYSANVPAASELIKVRYRTVRRSVARLASSASDASGAVPVVAQFAGSVEKPAARCSADCEAAVQAVLDFSTSTIAAWKGDLEASNLQQLASGDVWPGDEVVIAAPAMSVSAGNQAGGMLVRSVNITVTSAVPEWMEYSLGLANDWSEALSVMLRDAAAQDIALPNQPAPRANAVSADIPTADVTAITTSAITLAMNVSPPNGGGFEVRRQESGFGNGVNPGISPEGLVVRSAVATFTLPRSADHEELFIRMFDGSSPPLYSRVSAAVITNIPTQ